MQAWLWRGARHSVVLKAELGGLFVCEDTLDTRLKALSGGIERGIFQFAVFAFGLEQPNMHFMRVLLALFVGFAAEFFGL